MTKVFTSIEQVEKEFFPKIHVNEIFQKSKKEGGSAGKCPYCGKKMVKHIIKEGARYHVHSYDTNGVHCSEPNCENNHGPGHCVPRDADPFHGLSHKERIKKIFEINK
jgi:hypothetical protein